MHGIMEIVIGLSGQLTMQINGKMYHIGRGQAVLILPFEHHDFRSEQDSECLILEFYGDIVKPFFSYLQYHIPVKRLIDLSAELFDYLKNRIIDRLSVGNDLLRAQGLLMPLCLEFSEKGEFAEGKQQYDEMILEAINYLYLNIRQPVTLPETAEMLGICPETLSRRFAQVTGVNFKKYTQAIKIEFAISLMEQGASITEAAMDAGFGSIRTFDRVFKSFTGASPSAYDCSAALPGALLLIKGL